MYVGALLKFIKTGEKQFQKSLLDFLSGAKMVQNHINILRARLEMDLTYII